MSCSPHPDVVLFTRQDCSLCDRAQSVLRAAGLRPQLVDIESDPELVHQYGRCVPVVTIDGKVRFRGQVNPVLLRRLLQSS